VKNQYKINHYIFIFNKIKYKMEEDSKLNIVSNSINKLNLEYLMNRSQYKKYVSKTDPIKHLENEMFLMNVNKYKSRISNLTEKLLMNPEEPITLDVNNGFNEYVNILIKHFEMKDMENEDDDTMFEKVYDYSNKSNINERQELLEDNNKTKSVWGKNRVIKSQVMLPFSFSSKNN
jgi:hypothetical protein